MNFLFVDSMQMPEYDCDTPYTTGIGGTQSAICYYAEALAKENTVTVVVCNLKEPRKVRGVLFQPLSWLYTGVKTEVLVWCSGISKDTKVLIQRYIRADLKVAWIPHDSNETGIDHLESHLYEFDAFAFVSTWQQKKFIDEFNIPVDKTMLMLNGISPVFQNPVDPTVKKPIFLYTSQPDRGLHLLAETWPKIAEAYPTAELHTYGGRKLYGSQDGDQIKQLYEKMNAMSNVFIHGPVGQAELHTKCKEAAFFAYPAQFYETGCIALTEACAAGCIPIVSELGALGTYFKNCLTYDETLVEKFVERALKELKTFTESRDEYNAQSLKTATRFQEERDYTTLAKEFVKETGFFLEQKYKAVQTLERARKHFKDNNHRQTRLQLENMPRLFAKSANAFEYFLWLGVAHFYENSITSAHRYFNKAAKLSENLQLCVNLILTSEKLGNTDELLYWCERSLKYKFDLQIVHKIVNLVQKRSFFERSKWGNYLLSLWKDDIHNVDWTGIFMAHGNMIVGDCCMTMHHEEGIKGITDIITKGLAFANLHKVDLTEACSTRNSLEKLFSNLFLHLNYYETNNKEHFRYVQYFMKHLPPLKQTKPLIKFSKIPSNRKIRVAFLSGDLMYHPVGYILGGIVEHFDKSRFDVILFSTTEKKPENTIQNSFRTNSTEFVDLHGASVDSIVDAIQTRDIDLLIEMSGHTTTGTDQLSVIRAKPARVIAQYFAYPNTYGIPEVDYKIGDKHVFPTGLDQYYVEKFCTIKGGLHTYKPITDITINKTEHTGIVFGCTNNPKKYRPNWIKCVANILKRVPDSKFKCRYYFIDDPSIQEVYFKEFEKHGIERNRIDLGLGATLDKYFAAYSDMDICLDPFPYNGGTINIEILYASLPYITLLGNSYVSRVGASILHQVGHPELIAKTEEAYVEYAVALANDKERLDNYKATLRADMMKSTLGDNKAFTREFERGCEWMLKEKGWFSGSNTLSYA